MAIIFTNATIPNLTTTWGTPGQVTYIGRLAMWDPRIGRQLDFTHLGADLVYSRLWLPDEARADFGDIEHLAIENDLAEMRRVKNLATSQRPPQIGVALITALPPDREVTLDEAKEIAWQIVYEARKGYELAVFLVIHDPSLQSPGARNRHSHVFILTREMGPEGLAPTKIRRGIAQVRNGFVAEGIHWPNLTGEVLRTKLLEFGSDIVIDPIAPFPQTHLRPAGHGSNTGRIAFHRAQLMDDNLAAIHGDPAELLSRLLRGGSLLEIAELRRFVSKCIDSRHDQEEAVDLILTNSEIVTFADTANPEKARFVTTAAIHHSIDYAVELVDRARKEAGTIHTAVGADHSDVVAGINALIDQRSLDTEGGLLIIGSRLSDCEDMAQILAPSNPTVVTLKAVLGNVSDTGRSKRRALPAEALVIVPRAERVGDQDLATLLDLAERSEATVVLGKDVSVETGVVANRLVCHTVNRLTSSETISGLRVSPERLLRAGLITAAIKAMKDRLTFQSLDHSASDRDAFDFTVCTNNAAVKVAEKELSTVYGENASLGARPLSSWNSLTVRQFCGLRSRSFLPAPTMRCCRQGFVRARSRPCSPLMAAHRKSGLYFRTASSYRCPPGSFRGFVPVSRCRSAKHGRSTTSQGFVSNLAMLDTPGPRWFWLRVNAGQPPSSWTPRSRETRIRSQLY
jgi:hypothetical protein